MELIRKAVSLFRVPITKWYLRRERRYHHSGITIVVRPGVFHPGLFPSTKMLIRHLATINLQGLRLLELGCGSGLLALIADKAGAVVTATDVAQTAVENTKVNAAATQSNITILLSDLFDHIPGQVFDVIVINPPYYARPATNDAERAWYCGGEFEYFRKLFPQLKKFITKKSEVLMTLAQNADVATIVSIAKEHGFAFEVLSRRNTLLDGTDYLFRLTLQ